MSASDDKKSASASASESESFAISDAYVPTSRETLPVDRTDQALTKSIHADWSIATQSWLGTCALGLLVAVGNWFINPQALLVAMAILALATALIVRATWKFIRLVVGKNRTKTSLALVLGIFGIVIAWVSLCYAMNLFYYYSPYGDYGGRRSPL